MKVLDASATADALPFERLIPALRAMFESGCTMPPRHIHDIASPTGEKQFTSLIMPAWVEGRYYGIKTVNIAPGNAERGLPGLHASYVLFDATTGAPLAQIDGDQITTRRTAAASALAASWLARADASHLLVVGAGQVAQLLPEAYRAVRNIERVSIWARKLKQAEALVSELRRRDIAAELALDLQAAAGSADIISCATLATSPVIEGKWLRPGSHLDLIGSFAPTMREADDACFVDAALYVDTDEALQKSGDLLGPLARGVFKPTDVQGTLTSLCRGQAQGRQSAQQRTVFKSVGTALEDLAAAIAVYEAQGPSARHLSVNQPRPGGV